MSDRARALNSEIASLEAQIRQYESNLERMTSASLARGPLTSRRSSADSSLRQPIVPSRDLNLEEIGRAELTSPAELENDIVHVNELGVQKYDLPGFISKIRGLFRTPTTSNPKLVSYLAAGGIQGLRPLRYEKRVARNRFVVFALILLVLLIGLLMVFVPR